MVIKNVFYDVRNKRWYQAVLVAILLVLITACAATTPPLELSPNGDIVQKAIILQLSKTEQRLAERLKAARPELEINQITVKQIQPLYVAKLPTYHLQGTYNLLVKLPHQQVTQKNNPFDIYLQRQAEGKTWRLLRREVNRPNAEPQWSSYLIP